MASRGEITEPKEGGRRSGSRRWQQRGWKQHRTPCRDPCHATVTLKRRIQRHVLVDTAADRYDARHLQVIISLILFPFVSPSPRFPCRVAVCVCVYVCVCVQWRERKGRERCDGRVEEEEEGEAVFPKNRCGGVFEIRYLLRGDERINNKWKRFGGESGLENLISRLGRRVVIS